jgi:hypothetical protein
MLRSLLRAAAATLALVAVLPARAVDFGDSLHLHGYGDLAQTRSNVDASGERRGARLTTYNVSLVGTWDLSERTSVWAQVFQSNEPARPRIDWAYVDHRAANGLRWRGGQVRLPFGLHNEFRDVQALRPSATLPMVYDEELGIVDESFYGGSLESELRFGSSALSYEIYAAGALLPGGDRTSYGRAIGGRAIFETPLPGLSLRASAYSARLDPERDGARLTKRATALSLRWEQGPWDVQAETSRAYRYDHAIRAHYLQGSWQPVDAWELMARVERAVTDSAQSGNDAFKEGRKVLGVAWRFNHNLGVRLEHRWHRGYGLAVTQEVLEPGEGRPRWQSSVLSINYQF